MVDSCNNVLDESLITNTASDDGNINEKFNISITENNENINEKKEFIEIEKSSLTITNEHVDMDSNFKEKTEEIDYLSGGKDEISSSSPSSSTSFHLLATQEQEKQENENNFLTTSINIEETHQMNIGDMEIPHPDPLPHVENILIHHLTDRARLYVLGLDNDWIDRATGLLRTEIINQHVMQISLISEEHHDEILFNTDIYEHLDMSRQQDTVISWNKTDGEELALSFEKVEGCASFWHQICQFQHRTEEFELAGGISLSSMDDENEDSSTLSLISSSTLMGGGGGSRHMYLDDDIPSPRISADSDMNSNASSIIPTLPELIDSDSLGICEEIMKQSLKSPISKRALSAIILDINYIGKLVEIFRLMEDLHNQEAIYHIYEIFKSIVLLNSVAILRELLLDRNIIEVVGAFEYDPNGKHSYRQYLLDPNRFQQLIPVINDKNSAIFELIHQTFRAQYLKDVVLPKIMDDETFGMLVMLIRCNYTELVELVESNDTVYEQITPLLKSNDPILCSQTLKFFKEFLNIAKASMSPRQLKFYQSWMMSDFLNFTRKIFISNSFGSDSKHLAVDLILSMAQHDVSLLHNQLKEEKNRPITDQLMYALIVTIHDTEDIGLRWQLISLLKILFDSGNNPTTTLLFSGGSSGGGSLTSSISPTIESFLNYFYPDLAVKFLEPMSRLDKIIKENPIITENMADLLFNITELLEIFISQHKYRIKYLLLRSFILQNIPLFFQKDQCKYIKLTGLRIIRTLIDVNDDFYNRTLIKHNIFSLLLDQYESCRQYNNLYSSALMELFEYIQISKLSSLIDHLMEKWKCRLESLHDPIFDRIIGLYQAMHSISSQDGEDDGELSKREGQIEDEMTSEDHNSQDQEEINEDQLLNEKNKNETGRMKKNKDQDQDENESKEKKSFPLTTFQFPLDGNNNKEHEDGNENQNDNENVKIENDDFDNQTDNKDKNNENNKDKNERNRNQNQNDINENNLFNSWTRINHSYQRGEKGERNANANANAIVNKNQDQEEEDDYFSTVEDDDANISIDQQGDQYSTDEEIRALMIEEIRTERETPILDSKSLFISEEDEARLKKYRK